eukprot:SAG31_NODE_43080_length_268_cov_1.254438_1_plen_47_part_10
MNPIRYARPHQVNDPASAPLMYELAVRLNYSSRDKDNPIDMIGYIKG